MENKPEKFYTGGFLYNPKTKSVLLQFRDDKAPVNPNKWGFFGGTNEGDESPEECFIREIKEELAIALAPGELILFTDYLNTERNIWRYSFYVESEREKSEMILGEGADFDWIPLEKVFDYDLTDKTRADLEFFIERHGK